MVQRGEEAGPLDEGNLARMEPDGGSFGEAADVAFPQLHVVEEPRGLLAARRWQLVVKRILDVVGGAVLLVILSPILVIAGLAVALTSRGPVLFVHDRVGKAGRVFRLLKFRTMNHGAHDVKAEVAHLNETNGPVFKIRSDPRLTRIGRTLRKTSIDELPQLINVIRGEMSLVGPRPPLPEEVKTYGPREHQRLSVKPGLTCIWQVSGRSDLDFDTWVAMDIEYIESWNLRLDLRLLLDTVPAVVTGRGAY